MKTRIFNLWISPFLSPQYFVQHLSGSGLTESHQDGSELSALGNACHPGQPHSLMSSAASSYPGPSHFLSLFFFTFPLLCFSPWFVLNPVTGNCTIWCWIFRMQMEMRRLRHGIWSRVMPCSEIRGGQVERVPHRQEIYTGCSLYSLRERLKTL